VSISDAPAQVVDAGDLPWHDDAVGPQLTDLGERFCGRLVIPVVMNRDGCPFPSEFQRETPADPARATRGERVYRFEPHG
jgi:hypothetical protein